MFKPGQKIFEYEIIRLLGQGGFATVFEAKDIVLGRRVAIKQLRLDRLGDKKAIKRFIQEARIAAAMEHPNVVSIYGLRGEGNNFYMIMEYLPAGTLRDMLEKQGKLPVSEAVRLTIGVCEGLAKFHAKGIVHRDIKSENILLTADGRPKVIDFGIAHVPEDLGGMALTRVGFQPSSLLYSSPEQIRGQDLDARSDVYQIGQLLYHMLTGNHLIDLKMLEKQAVTHGGTSQFRSQAKLYELLEHAICDETPPGLQSLWREVGALAGAVEKALAKDKSQRFSNAAEFASALKAFGLNLTEDIPSNRLVNINNPISHNSHGLANVKTRNYEQAIIDYSEAIEGDARYAEAYNNRSTTYLLMDNYWQALIDSNWALELAPNYIPAYINRAIAQTGLRNYEQAIAVYHRIIQLDPRNFYAYYNLGNTYIWMQNFEAALANYNRAIDLRPDFVAAFVNRGVAHHELKQSEAALADLNRAIELNPDYEHAYFNRATVQRELENYESAIADYTRVIQLNPERLAAYKNRGDIFKLLGDEVRAQEDYDRQAAQQSGISRSRFSVARSMFMPNIPLDTLKQRSAAARNKHTGQLKQSTQNATRPLSSTD